MFDISTGFLILCVILLLTLPLRWILAAFLSACIHELCHLIAIKAFRKDIYHIKIGVFGAEIQTQSITGWSEFLCLLAGPAGSLLLLLLFRWLPLTAFFGFIQGIFNLLPVLPLDGGRMLLCALQKYMNDDVAWKVYQIIAFVVLSALIAASGYFIFHYRAGKWLILVVVVLLIQLLYRKIPCKLVQLRVQ